MLVPWPNRLRDGKYTFDGRRLSSWPLTEPRQRATRSTAWGGGRGGRRWRSAPASVTLAIDLVPQTGWLFEVRVEVTYTLEPRPG